MSTDTFPTLPGLAWPVVRSPLWQTRQQDSISGKRLNIADWSYPKHRWSLTYNFLRGDPTQQTEWQTLEAFFNSRYGAFDSFLYNDPRDNSATGSTIATGDSTATSFQLYRTFGSSLFTFTEPVYAPTSISSVAVGGTTYSSTQWTIQYWGSTAPGVLSFSTVVPTTAQAIVVSFGFSFPCSFDDDQLDFEEFVKQIWSLNAIKWTSLK